MIFNSPSAGSRWPWPRFSERGAAGQYAGEMRRIVVLFDATTISAGSAASAGRIAARVSRAHAAAGRHGGHSRGRAFAPSGDRLDIRFERGR